MYHLKIRESLLNQGKEITLDEAKDIENKILGVIRTVTPDLAIWVMEQEDISDDVKDVICHVNKLKSQGRFDGI